MPGDIPPDSQASKRTRIGAGISFVAGLFLLISFASPYWIESQPELFSRFKQMGLWEYCFDRLQLPSNFKLLHGCYYIFSEEMNAIREWLLPNWLRLVQYYVTLAFLFFIPSQVLLICVIVRKPSQTVLRNEWIFVTFAFILITYSCLGLLLAVAIFGSNWYRGDWLLYTSFNVLSWCYIFAVIAFVLFYTDDPQFVYPVGAFPPVSPADSSRLCKKLQTECASSNYFQNYNRY